MKRVLAVLLSLGAAAGAAPPASRLRVAVVQMALGPSIEANRGRIVSWTAKAAARGARVVVFPEGALSARSEAPEGDVPAAVESIRGAARAGNIYVLFGAWTWSERHKRNVNWMKVIAPDGAELLHYDKLWDVHDAPTPAIFHLDGVPASAIICADRWLRALEDLPVQRGARISFELSNNFDAEWVPELEWYWYVPRALRNSIWVVFANSGNRTPGKPEPGVEQRPRHGHSAIVAPDGSLAAAARGDVETMLVADLDIARANRAEALSRGAHPVLGAFWRAGSDLLSGRTLPVAPLVQKESAAAEITVAAAQIPESADPDRNSAAMVAKIAEAARGGANLVAFPELALTGGRIPAAEVPIDGVRQAARAHRITVVFGAPRREAGVWRNSAFAIGPDGAILTRYDQLAAQPPFSAGTNAAAMWFGVEGVPAVVTIGREALWNEIAELAAVAGARLHVNIAREPVNGPEAALRRRQIGAALGSFSTISVMSNAGGYSAIWDDLRGREEARAVVRGLPRPDTGPVMIYSPFSANLAAEARSGPALISMTRQVPGKNPHHPQRTANFHPAMGPWYESGARMLTGLPAK